MRRSWTKWLGVVVIFLLAVSLILVLHEMLVLTIAVLLRSITAADLAKPIARVFVSSPVYSALMLETVGGIDARGVAVAGAPGNILHQSFSGLFLDPQNVTPGALVSAVIDRNSTVLSILITRGIAEVFLILFGGMLIRAGWHRRNSSGWSRLLPGRGWLLVGLGLFTQAQAIRALANLTLSPLFPGMRETGIGFGLSRLLGLDYERYHAVMDQWLPIAIPIGFVVIGFIATLLAGKFLDRVRAILRWPPGRDRTALPRMHHAAALALLTLLTALSPWSHGYFNLAKLNAVARPQAPYPARVTRTVTGVTEIRSVPVEPSGQMIDARTPVPGATEMPPIISPIVPTSTFTGPPTPSPFKSATPTTFANGSAAPSVTPAPTGPARTEIRRGARAMELFVNGRRAIVTGMNYNVNYTGMPEATKRALHRRDFKVLHDAGVNALIGWGVYDEVTLQVASEYQIGVIMPFELNPQGAYENEGYRNQVKSDFRDFVKRYKSFPAVWGWNPGGDELLHRMDTEQHRTTDRLQDAADLLVQMSALAYSLDTEHISIVKEPRDWYIPYFDIALKNERSLPQHADPARYFVFGLNVYGHPSDVEDALNAAKRNAEERLQVGMIVGEYAPFGLPREDRPIHYAIIWDQVVSDTPNGGFVYVFGPDQPNPAAPNPYDPLRLLVNEFSLFDIGLNPVDDTFSTLATRWRQAQTHFSQP